MTGLLLSLRYAEDYDAFETFLDRWEKENGSSMQKMGLFGRSFRSLSRADFIHNLSLGLKLTADDGSSIDCYYYNQNVLKEVRFTPLYRDDDMRLNVNNISDDVILSARYFINETDCFTILTRYSFEIPEYFAEGNKRYETPEEIIEEFKDRVGKYFPEDFKWKTHIGYIHLFFRE